MKQSQHTAAASADTPLGRRAAMMGQGHVSGAACGQNGCTLSKSREPRFYHPPGGAMSRLSASRATGPLRPSEPSRRPRDAASGQNRPAPPPFDRGASPSPNPASTAASAPRPAPLPRRTSLRRRFRPCANAVALLCSISDAIARRATLALWRGTAGAACLLALVSLAAPGAQAQTEIWSATLTPQATTTGGRTIGCSNSSSSVHLCSNTSALTDDDFTYNSTNYRVTRIALQTSPGLVSIFIDPAFTPSGTVVLMLDTTSLKFSEGDVSGRYWNFWDADFAGTAGTDISVRLVSLTASGKPTGLTATAGGPSQIDLVWTAPANTGGSAITGYKIEMSPDGSSWSDLVDDTGSTATTYTDMGLTAGTTRHYRVSAVNEVGVSDASESDEATLATIQSEVLVSNFAQSPTEWVNLNDRQSNVGIFTTGSGATLGSIEFRLSTRHTPPDPAPSATLYRATVSGSQVTPGMEVAALAAPSTKLTGSAQIFTYIPPGGTSLDPLTTYMVVLETTETYGPRVRVLSTTSLDTGGAHGWTISGRGLGPSSPYDYLGTSSLLMRVNGERIAAANNEATGAPTITGTSQVGQILTADPSAIADADGTAGVEYTYQWVRVNADGVSSPMDITDEISGTYTLTTADEGKRIKVKVGFTDNLGSAESRTSEAYPAAGATVSAANTASKQGVPADWALKPADIGGGGQFRLMFVSSTSLDATSTDVTDYNRFVRARAGDVTALSSYATDFNALVSTDSVNARENTFTRATDTDVPIYWVRSSAPAATDRVADDYADFYDGAWATGKTGYNEAGVSLDLNASATFWTGTTLNGLTHGMGPLGGSSIAGAWTANGDSPYALALRLVDSAQTLRIAALSPVFQVANTAPGKPTGLTATANGRFQIDLAWTAPDDNGGGAISGYRIEVSPDGIANWSDLVDDTESTATTYNDTGLDPGTTRHYRVSAINEIGTSDASDSDDATTVANQPPEFTGTSTTVSVAENTPADQDIGSPATVSDADGDTPTFSFVTTGGVTTDYQHFDLDAASGQLETKDPLDHEDKSSYVVSVQASDAYGGIDTFAYTIAVTDVAEPPDAPATPMVSAVAGSTTSVTVSWAAPANDGRPAIESYDMQYRAGDSGPWTAGPQDVTTTSATITGLTMDTAYQVQVRASNDEGDSGWSEPPGEGRTNLATNNAPMFDDTMPTRVLAENAAAGVDVGDPVTATDEDDDELTYTLGGTDAASFDIVGTSGQIRTIAGVSYDHEAKASYSVTVTASDGTATTDAGVTIAVTDVNEPPDAPATPVVSAISGSTTSLTVSWDAPANAGRPDIENYDLQYRAGDSGPWSNGPQNVTGTSETITGLTMDTAYQVQVRATNYEGDSGWSEPPGEGRTNAVTLSAPDAPGNFDTTAGDGRVTLSWTAPASDGGAAILNYRYRVRPADDSAAWNPDWTDVPDGSDPGSSAADETRFVVSGLSNGTQYTFELRAENSAGEGAVVSANETPLAAPPDEPGRPRGLQADAGDGQVTLRWEAPLDDGGSSITEYQYRHGEGASVPAGATWHSAGLNSRQTVTGLTNGRQYSFEVRAANSAGEGPPASIQARPEAIATAPSAPRFLKAVTSNGQVRLSWFAPERDGGSSITEYQYRHAAGRSVPDDTPWGSVERRRLQVRIGSLRNGQRCTFQVRAMAAAAGPVASVTATPVASPERQPPGAVTGLSATAEATVDERTRKQSARVTLQWRPPAADDNSVLERFEYRWAESGSALPDRWVHGSADSTSETIERLKRGTRYVFEGRAVNLEGPGPAARTAVATPAAEAGVRLYARQPTAIEGGAFTFEVRRPGHLDLGPDEAIVLVGVTDSAFPHIPALGGSVGGNGAGGRVVRFQSGARSASGTITVEFDGERPASRSLTITLQAVNSPYIYGSPLRLDIPVSDRDAGLSVRDASVREGPGARLEFRVTLDRRRDREVTVSYATADGTATVDEDYTRTVGTLVFSARETSKTVSVPVLDDAHNEASETLTLTLSNASGAVIDDATAVGTIVNSDSMPDAWLSRFGRAASDQVVQSIGRRLEGGARESHLTVMGLRVDSVFESSHPGWDGREPDGSLRAPDGRIGPPGAMAGGAGGVGAMPAPGAAPADDNRWLDLVGRLFMTLGPNGAHRPGLRDLVMGSSFHYGHSPDGGAFRGMSRVAAWGESASTRFSGTEGRLALDGEVDTAIVGVDGEGDRWMGGLALSYSEGGGAYRHASASGGAVSSTLGGINPYARYELNERTSIWGTLGYGSGRLTLTPEAAAAAIETDLTNRMAAFGGRGVLSVRGGESGRFELALRSDAMFTDTASPAVPGLSGGEGATSRIRLIVEGSGSAAALGGTLTPRVEAGLRYDGGDAETGAGLEVGGALAYDIARLTVQVDGRVLLTHRDRDYEESGYSVSVRYKPGGNGRGLQLEGGSQWGATQSGVQSLWSLKNAGGLRSGVPARNAQAYTGELGYGFGARRLWYPYVATESGGASSRSLRFGLKLSAGPGLEAGLEIGRRADGFGRTENDIRLRWSARW